MKLIIAGSRSIVSYDTVRQAVIDTGVWKEFGRSIEVVCGMAKGVDLLGKQFADRNGLVVHEFPANWKPNGVYDHAAGHKRNRQMGDFADRLLAVWDGQSGGTKGMIDYMIKLEKPVYVYRTDQK